MFRLCSLKCVYLQFSETSTKNKPIETPETSSTKMSTRLRKAEIETPVRKGSATPFVSQTHAQNYKLLYYIEVGYCIQLSFVLYRI